MPPPRPSRPRALLTALLPLLLPLLTADGPTPSTAVAEPPASISLAETPWVSPTGDVQPLRAFDPPASRWGSGHRGVDLAMSPGRTEVLSPAPGRIRFAGTVVDRGVVTVEHDDGRLSSFEPVRTELSVGDRVAAGQPIAVLDDSVRHCPTSCLHWGVRAAPAGARGEPRYLDPLWLLGAGGPSVPWPSEGLPPWEAAEPGSPEGHGNLTVSAESERYVIQLTSGLESHRFTGTGEADDR